MQLLGKHERSDEALAGWRALAEAGRNRKVSPPPAAAECVGTVQTRLDEEQTGIQASQTGGG